MRFPDAAANPYLAIAAIAMAGLDGVLRGLDPGPPRGDDPRRAAGATWDVRRRAADGFALDLAEAIVALDADRRFLAEGGVFDDALVEALAVELNRQLRVNRGLPHPNEYYMYFSA
jgi:glutamine synthetase